MNCTEHVSERTAGVRDAEYAYPLRPDFVARLVLPTDLTADEVQRLRAFLLSLAQPEPSCPRGAGDHRWKKGMRHEERRG